MEAIVPVAPGNGDPEPPPLRRITPDRSLFSGMDIIDMRMHMNFGDAQNAFSNGKDSDDSVNDATYNVVYVDSHDYGPNKSNTRYSGGTDAWAENMALMWTFRGIPTLYYGSEIEFQKGKQIDCGPSCPLASTGRAYFGDHLAGSVTASDFGTVTSASGTVATTLASRWSSTSSAEPDPPCGTGPPDGPVLDRRDHRRDGLQTPLHQREHGQLRAGHGHRRGELHGYPERHVHGRRHG